jgi:DNA-binding NtrC family response regulator
MTCILLAESDRRISEFIAGILSDCGHIVEICADGVEAAAALGVRAVDVVVTDLVLGLGQGAALGQYCQALGIPTITLSGHEFHPNEAMADRPPRFLEKPFRFDDLHCILDAVAVHCGSAQRPGRLNGRISGPGASHIRPGTGETEADQALEYSS